MGDYQADQHMNHRNTWRKREKKDRKNVWRNNGQNLSKSGERDESVYPYSFVNPNRKNSKRSTTAKIIIKLLKDKTKRILKAAREKQLITYEGLSIRLTDYFS